MSQDLTKTTLREAAAEMGVCTGRAWTIEQQALAKLREALADVAEDYFEDRPSFCSGRWNGKRLIRVSR